MPKVVVVMIALALVSLPAVTAVAKEDRETIVRNDRERVLAAGYWIYNDLDAAVQQARQTGRPILVVLRCLPCEECVKLDDDLVESDPEIKALLDQFVRVRIVGTNGLDLNVFQYDTDQSFAVFMINADKTVYGRFGTRSHRTEWLGDVSLEGMAAALREGLKLHDAYPANRDALAGKSGQPLEFESPEKYPTLRKHPDRLDYEGEVANSCIHCHQIGEARRDFYWQSDRPIPEELLHPFPHPKSIGLILDPRYPARIKQLVDDSVAKSVGFQVGDDVTAMNGQPIVSMADVQWALNQVPGDGGSIDFQVRRGEREVELSLALPKAWRRWDDPAWRISSWMMRRIAGGGMRLIPEDDAATSDGTKPMAFRVANAGKHGAHGAAHRAGVKVGDILIEYDGRNDFRREADIFNHVNDNHRPGDRVTLKLVRNGRTITTEIPIQK
ncbi:Trx7/PDZ domain-containing (seleno)protein [Crateriforma conspicua]|uniref:Trx7/PDZ domain-containing (seleno)protein n=1 Tax=Crateriforma conspicua TaxID=2527996 RepID=UPI00118A3797|nr:Trx7/PDZ domain-containing (seleno)protein [Crateriforma conspicua]QDV62351.1 serine endoprotease [Crateriforma conspicua]